MVSKQSIKLLPSCRRFDGRSEPEKHRTERNEFQIQFGWGIEYLLAPAERQSGSIHWSPTLALQMLRNRTKHGVAMNLRRDWELRLL